MDVKLRQHRLQFSPIRFIVVSGQTESDRDIEDLFLTTVNSHAQLAMGDVFFVIPRREERFKNDFRFVTARLHGLNDLKTHFRHEWTTNVFAVSGTKLTKHERRTACSEAE